MREQEANGDAFWEKLKKAEPDFGKYDPTIFVGLGGTGAKILHRIRRLSLERFGGVGEEYLPGVAYLLLDSDIASVFGAEPLPGLADDEVLHLDIREYQESFSEGSSLENPPHLSEWLDPSLARILGQLDPSMGCGQIRPLGRLTAVAHHPAIASKIADAADRVMRSAATAPDAVEGKRVRVVLCGSLAGGTGAGILFDVLAIVRTTLGSRATIDGVLLLPELFSGGDGAGKVMANGYASLAELAHWSRNPYQLRSAAQDPAVEVHCRFDQVELVGRRACWRGPSDATEQVAETLFFPFYQRIFVRNRASVRVNRVQVLCSTHQGECSLEDSPKLVSTGSFSTLFSMTGHAGISVASRAALRLFAWRLVGHVLELDDVKRTFTSMFPQEEDQNLRATIDGAAREGIRLARASFDSELRSPNVISVPPLDSHDGWVAMEADYLGQGAEARTRSLSRLWESVQPQLAACWGGVERAAPMPGEVVQALFRACEAAVKGVDGQCIAFGRVREGWFERYPVLRVLTEQGDDWVARVGEMVEVAVSRALPVLREKALPGVDCMADAYIVVPPGSEAGRDAIRNALAQALNRRRGWNWSVVDGEDPSEVVIYMERTGIATPHLESMYGPDGMSEAYRSLNAARRNNDINGFVHTHRDVGRFPALLPLSVDEVRDHVDAWKLLILSVMLGHLRPRKNDAKEAVLDQVTDPCFEFETCSDGQTLWVQVGSAPVVVRSLSERGVLRKALQKVVDQSMDAVSPRSCVRLLLLARYFRLCIFPRWAPPWDQDPNATLPVTVPHRAVCELERDLFARWRQSSPDSTLGLEDIVGGAASVSLGDIAEFTRCAGGPDGAVWAVDLDGGRYHEHPPGTEESGTLGDDGVSIRKTFQHRLTASLPANALPADLAALLIRDWEGLWYPWLTLAPR